ncbi:MAG: cell envelope integrity protein CreD [Thermodesulfobacteriota bacterium]
MTEAKSKLLHRSFLGGTAAKVALIVFLILLLEIPMARINGLIAERERRSRSVVEEVWKLWGGLQVISGPVLVVPFVTRSKESVRVWDEEKKTFIMEDREKVERHAMTVLPEKLAINGAMGIQKRYRGIYEAPVYEAELSLSGRFGRPDFSGVKVLPEDIDWKQARVWMGVSDLRGIRKAVAFSWAGKPCGMQPEAGPGKAGPPGLAAFPGLSAGGGDGVFSLSFTVDGSEELLFSPAGRTTEVALSSAWPHPGFVGGFLPYDRDVTDTGFKARWSILEVNRPLPRTAVDETLPLAEHAFGVRVVTPVNVYLMASRAAKYSTVFIALTFFALFVSELIARVRLHSIQYLMAGLAVVIFYALLLSLSEHVGFSRSYGAAAAAVTLLIGIYASGALGKKALALLVAGVLAVLYAYWYVLLQMEDYSLVFGCVGSFLLLAAVMLGTRRTDWRVLDRKLLSRAEIKKDGEEAGPEL